ncbi:nucleobase:cation symporter-2 family protein [Actinoallomurus bryophytorum]|uniref:Xanthine/uracil permease n=1 Tax=Actinoallomurus bryophytorum TaxID=1490222 RepID=A0A543CPG8_9ACTN|nr:solute carrier family 23 protein [Actinoallomurus bryophytorum]TQL98995.1 xanthine/uracil permease [Actinoallomurus bryophytorum]
MTPSTESTAPHDRPRTAPVFDVGIDERVPVPGAIGLGVQNILGMAGLLIFPALIGTAFKLSPADVAYLYGVTFMTSGLVVILQSVFLLRLPIVQGPYAGSLAALLAVGHAKGGSLGSAFGSMVVAGMIWCVLALPLRRFGLITQLSRFVRDPIISAVIVLILATQLTSTALPNWLGTPQSPGFPSVNLVAGGVGAVLVIALTVLPRGRLLRRLAVLVAVVAGTIVYAIFEPTSFGEVGRNVGVVVPKFFPFGFAVHGDLVLIFFITLFPAIVESIATYDIVAGWGGQDLSGYRVSQGVFGEVLGSTIGAIFGGMSTLAYPDNIGLLRATRVGSRYVTLTTGIILLALGGLEPFDRLLEAVPLPVLAAVGTVLFGVLFASAIDVLGGVRWTRENLMLGGVPFITAIGGLFIPEPTLQAMPMVMRLIFVQPMILGTVLLIVLKAAFGLRRLRDRDLEDRVMGRAEPADTTA